MAVYLGTFNIVLSIVFVAFYLAMCYIQSYCCTYQDCPHVNGFCPAVLGIVPATWLAKRHKVVKSERTFEVKVTLGIGCWLGLAFFPVWWIAKLGVLLALGYVGLHVVYAVIFGLTVCPVCAIRETCPGGKFQSAVKLGKQSE